MRLNVELLEKVKAHILEEPRRLNMTDWLQTNSRRAPCGTAACIAGWACVLSGRNVQWFDVSDVALDLLGAHTQDDSHQLYELFYTFPPRKLKTGSIETAEWVAAKIDAFIAEHKESA